MRACVLRRELWPAGRGRELYPPPLGRVGGEEGDDYDNQASSFMKVNGAAELGVV